MSNFSNRINELLGSEGPMKLSQVDTELANAVAATDAGTKDGSGQDDKYVVDLAFPVEVAKLFPAQKEVIPMKALSFALGNIDKNDPSLEDMQAIVSSDMYIMDGHHRWAAATLVNPKQKVNVCKIEMPAEDLITALNIYTKGALYANGNQGAGDLSQWKTGIKEAIETAFEKGFSEEAGNAILPGNTKPNWPMFSKDGKGKTAEEVQAIFGKVLGANGDPKKGKEIMIANSDKLNTKKLSSAPNRIDMPVIEAGLTVDGKPTSDVRQSQLYDVCKRIENGSLDLNAPYGKEVSDILGESRIIKTYEGFISRYKK